MSSNSAYTCRDNHARHVGAVRKCKRIYDCNRTGNHIVSFLCQRTANHSRLRLVEQNAINRAIRLIVLIHIDTGQIQAIRKYALTYFRHSLGKHNLRKPLAAIERTVAQSRYTIRENHVSQASTMRKHTDATTRITITTNRSHTFWYNYFREPRTPPKSGGINTFQLLGQNYSRKACTRFENTASDTFQVFG